MTFLINGYFLENDRTSSNYVAWKIHFTKHTEEQINRDGSVLGDFNFLEEKGKLKVGKYDVLKEMFEHIDDRAVTRISEESERIEEILSSKNKEKNKSKEESQENSYKTRQEKNAWTTTYNSDYKNY